MDCHFPLLSVACARLRLDEHALAESILARMDAGEEPPLALRGVVVDALARRGRYHGRVMRMVDSGEVFRSKEGE